MWPQTGGRVETIALRLSGNLETAFPEGRAGERRASACVEGEAPPPPPTPPAPSEEPAAPLARSATPAEIVIVADVDFLADDFYVDPQSGGSAADNASFALNAIDVLGGSDALVSLRSRAPSLRRMELVEDMERGCAAPHPAPAGRTAGGSAGDRSAACRNCRRAAVGRASSPAIWAPS